MRLRGLYAITPAWPESDRMLAAVEAALDGGASALQLRRKHLAGNELRKEAHALAALCRRYGVPLIVNDDPRLALECGAEGVHLGREDGDVLSARAILGRGKLIGVSCYGEVARVQAAEAVGADYAAMGSLFPSTSKPTATLTNLAALAAARRVTKIPLVGIGGIGPGNAALVKEAGADMVAVIGTLFESASIRNTARLLSDIWE